MVTGIPLVLDHTTSGVEVSGYTEDAKNQLSMA